VQRYVQTGYFVSTRQQANTSAGNKLNRSHLNIFIFLGTG